MGKAAPGSPVDQSVNAAGELALRLTGAALQVIATVVVVRALAPQAVGIYFEGFVIALALASLLRGKYEMLVLRYVLGESAQQTCIPVIDLLTALSKRIAIRCVLVCGVLLVVIADLDIMEPRLRAFLDTFLPFVLAVPFLAVALFLSSALRAARRSIGSTIISAYAVNLAVILSGLIASPENALVMMSWAFVAGSAVASVIGILLVRKVFPAGLKRGVPQPCVADWRQIYGLAAFDYGIAGLAFSALQWGPLCVLAIAGPALQIAEVAVTLRLALAVELMMPALVFVPLGLNIASRLIETLSTERGRLVANLVLSALAASGFSFVLMIFVPQLLGELGAPYAELTGLFVILLAAQWINAAARPALRFMTTYHYKPVLQALCLSAVIALIIALFGVNQHGAYAVATATLIGTLVLNAHSLLAALRQSSGQVIAPPA
ncbi:hypothetical protein [Hydrocarboniphaga sp.]|uniref:hypothetical protein n=1 Tax=Hydrocarboniphaga sp. TaxID=2033016 RepID=UPI00261FB15D|nr:hypothetical protein [Hydrocarboniphaga sp.]